MNNSDAAGSITTESAPVDLPATAYPTDGALVSIAEGDTVRRGWISVDHSAPVGGTAWVALVVDGPSSVWTGHVAAESITVDEVDAPEWWGTQTVDLLQALVRAARGRAALVEDAHRWADDNSLCGVFDRFMRDHQMPPRRREFSAPTTVTLTLALDVPVVARYGEDAGALIGQDLIEQAVRQRFGGLRRHGLAVGDYEVGELQEVVL